MLILMGNCSLKKLWSPCLPTDFCFFMNLARSKSLIILSVGDLHELFSPNWIDFQMFKLVLEKAEEPGINCQHLLDRQKSKRVPEKHLFLLY